MQQVRVVSASEIARYRFPLKRVNERARVLGKAFEVGFSYVSWLISKNCSPIDIFDEIEVQKSKKIGRKINIDDNKNIDDKDMDWLDENDYQFCNGCMETFSYDICLLYHEYDYFCADCFLKEMEKLFFEKIDEDITKLSAEEKKYFKKLFYLFLEGNVAGQTPATIARRHDNYIITAKPDLWNYQSPEVAYCEFKIYPLDDYAREQAKIFAWVINESVWLCGVSSDLKLEREIICPPQDIGEIPEIVGELHNVDEICENCNLPNCNCKPIYRHNMYEGEEDDDLQDY